jgi:hypothetical protein
MQQNPVLARLDRAFANHDHSLAFPSSTLTSLPRPTCDHTPLLLTMSTNVPKAFFFRFENAWLHNTSFLPSILPAWQQAPFCTDAAGQLSACIKSTRAAAKVWSRCNRAPPDLIPNCKFLIQLFDYYEEIRLLSYEEFQTRREIQERLAHELKTKAAYWTQRTDNQRKRCKHSVPSCTGDCTSASELHPLGTG